MRARELLLKIMAVLAKVSTLRERLRSVLVDPCLYYCCTAHQALAALRSLCTEGCARTVRSTCVGVRNVIREFIWTAATVLFAQVRTGYFDAYCMCGLYAHMHSHFCVLCMILLNLLLGLPHVIIANHRPQTETYVCTLKCTRIRSVNYKNVRMCWGALGGFGGGHQEALIGDCMHTCTWTYVPQ